MPAAMSKALFLDLRVRVLAAVADGASHRVVALRFGVSVATVSRWHRRAAAQGDPGPKALGGDRRSGRTEQHREQILGMLADQPDLTIQELRREAMAPPEDDGRDGEIFGFGEVKIQGGQRQTRFRRRVEASFVLALAACNLVRWPRLLATSPR